MVTCDNNRAPRHTQRIESGSREDGGRVSLLQPDDTESDSREILVEAPLFDELREIRKQMTLEEKQRFMRLIPTVFNHLEEAIRGANKEFRTQVIIPIAIPSNFMHCDFKVSDRRMLGNINAWAKRGGIRFGAGKLKPSTQSILSIALSADGSSWVLQSVPLGGEEGHRRLSSTAIFDMDHNFWRLRFSWDGPNEVKP